MSSETSTKIDPESKVKPLSEEIADKLPCPEGDMFTLPTVADLTNMFAEIAQLPGKLDAKILEMKAEKEKEIVELNEQLKNPDLTAEEIAAIEEQIKEKEDYIEKVILGELKEEIDKVIEDITGFVDTLASALDPFWTKEQTRNWQKEARDAFAELLQEFHTYIPTKIAELIGKLIPALPTINVLGLEIDIIKLVASPSYQKELQAQIGGSQFVTQIKDIKKQLAELNEKGKNPDLTDEEQEAIQEEIDKLQESVVDLEKLRGEWIDKFFMLIPEEFRLFDGEFGVVDPDAKAKLTWKYIKTEIKEWIQNWYMKAFEKLIGIFDKIWSLLGLPDLPISELLDIMSLDIGALIRAQIEVIKTKWKSTKLAKKRQIKKLDEEIEELKLALAADDISIDEHIKFSEELDEKIEEKKKLEEDLLKEKDKFLSDVKDAVGGISIFGFDILKMIGGEIVSTAESLEEEIAEICMTLKDFKANWHKKIMFEWVTIIKKFISAIGLGAIFDFMFLTWCDFLKIIGMPMGVNISLPAIAGVISTVQKKTESHANTGQSSGSDEGIAYATGDGERTAYSVSSGTGTVHAFVTAGTIPEGQENAGDPLVTEYEHGSGVTISGNTVTFTTAPAIGAAVSIIKI
jgi:hypothetical protein